MAVLSFALLPAALLAAEGAAEGVQLPDGLAAAPLPALLLAEGGAE
jgi:hypothetical protein